MTQTRTYDGITYTARPNEGDKSRIVWEGGRKGGSVFVGKDGRFGDASAWFDTFEEAAKVKADACRVAYLRAKKIVDEYEGRITDE